MLDKIELFGITIYMYPLFVFFGILSFIIYCYIVLCKIEKENDAVIYKTILVAVPSIAILAIMAFILNSLFHSIEAKKIVLGGITWSGGVIGGFTAFPLLTHFFIKEKRGREIHFFSKLVPGIVLAHMFGRIGCFFAGCCFGRITSCPLGLVFPEGSAPAMQYTNFSDLTNLCSYPVMPVQLYEAFFELILFLVMVLNYKKIKNDNMQIYLFFYGLFRFFIEFFRGDNRGSTGLYISPSQLMCVLFVFSSFLIFLNSKKFFLKKKDKSELSV